MTKDELITKHRYFNVEHSDWWDCAYSDFTEQMTAIGIEVDRIYFSGFCSQGDGACFEGRVDDWDLFLESLGYTSPALSVLAQNSGWKFHVTHSGHYYHENCTSFSSTSYLDHPDNTDATDDNDWIRWCSPYKTDTQNAAFLAVLRTYDIESLHNEFVEAFKSHMRQLYRDLEKEHDYLTSDEVVWESLKANDMTDELEETNV